MQKDCEIFKIQKLMKLFSFAKLVGKQKMCFEQEIT